jgi:ribulose-phosphate 3-epimerase
MYPILNKVDLVLIMSVEPGFGGQSYLPGSNERISQIKQYLNDNCLDRVLIEVDGGIKLHNVTKVLDSGADVIVAGSEIFKADDPVQTIQDFYLTVE